MMPAADPMPVTGEERAALERIAKSTSQSHRAVLQAKGCFWPLDGWPTTRSPPGGSYLAHCHVMAAEFPQPERGGGRSDSAWPGGASRGCEWGQWPKLCGSRRKNCPRTARHTGLPKPWASDWDREGQRGPDLEGPRAEAPEGRDFQDLQRPRPRGEAGGCGGLVHEPSRTGSGLQCRREDSAPNFGPHSADLNTTTGRAGTLLYDYKRTGTTDLYAALNNAPSKPLTDCRERHTAKDFVRFFRVIDRNVPAELDVHLVLDDLSAHKALGVQAWLAHPKRRRFHMHFTPTSSSWANLVER